MYLYNISVSGQITVRNRNDKHINKIQQTTKKKFFFLHHKNVNVTLSYGIEISLTRVNQYNSSELTNSKL